MAMDTFYQPPVGTMRLYGLTSGSAVKGAATGEMKSLTDFYDRWRKGTQHPNSGVDAVSKGALELAAR